ncbi:MAG: molybdopterin-dependent oxidoreductase, partial [Acidimicrobiia bacterium]
MAIISRGFKGRRQEDARRDRVPPGQYVTIDFPVLSAGPTPLISLDKWSLSLTSETGQTTSWTWDEFSALPTEVITVDIHCVTKWSKLDTSWEGVSLDTLLDGVQTAAGFLLVESFDGYTTNLPLADATNGK